MHNFKFLIEISGLRQKLNFNFKTYFLIFSQNILHHVKHVEMNYGPQLRDKSYKK